VKRSLWLAVLVMLVLGGCQTKPPTTWMPLPLPLELAPSTKLTIVGKGATAEAARQAGIEQLVRQVILPATDPASAPTAEFVANMIRGYNVSDVTRDFLGDYYVTVELTISQLGINYQELYHAAGMARKETAVLSRDIENERELRGLADEKARRAADSAAEERKTFNDRILKLQARRKLDEQRISELSQQRLTDEKAVRQMQNEVKTLQEQVDKLSKQVAELQAGNPSP
jgi:uncharacterized coiled-coil protein SlyX